MGKVRYCYLDENLKFSGSWGEEEHKSLFNDTLKGILKEKGWRVVKYEVVEGEDFEFPYEAILVKEPKV